MILDKLLAKFCVKHTEVAFVERFSVVQILLSAATILGIQSRISFYMAASSYFDLKRAFNLLLYS